MRLAIANWGDRVSPVLDTAASLTLVEHDGAGETGRTVVHLDSGSLLTRAQQIAGLGLDGLICGAVSRPLFEMLSAAGVEVLPFVAGEVGTVLAAFLRGELPHQDFTLPGCCCRWRGQGPGNGAGHRGRGGWGAARLATLEGAACRTVVPAPGQTRQGGATVIVVSARGETTEALVDSRFGRTAFFVSVDPATGAVEAHSNKPNLEAPQGAGIQAAQFVAGLGAKVLISGNVGPKAFRVLQAAGIRMYRCEGGTVAEAVSRLKADDLPEVTAATVPGHWA